MGLFFDDCHLLLIQFLLMVQVEITIFSVSECCTCIKLFVSPKTIVDVKEILMGEVNVTLRKELLDRVHILDEISCQNQDGSQPSALILNQSLLLSTL